MIQKIVILQLQKHVNKVENILQYCDIINVAG